MAVGYVEHIVWRPAIVKTVCPDAENSALGHSLHIVVGKFLPLTDGDGIKPGVVGTGARRNVQIRNRFVQVMQHLWMPIQEILHHDLRKLEAHGERIAIVVVLYVVAPIDEWG